MVTGVDQEKHQLIYLLPYFKIYTFKTKILNIIHNILNINTEN